MRDVALPRGMTINEVIRMYPDTVTIFSRHGIDACCGGALPVAEAAARHGIDVDRLLRELADAMRVEA